MGRENGDIQRLLGSLYEGLAYPVRWSDFLQEVCRQLKCDVSTIIFHDPENIRPTISHHAGIPGEAVREYGAYYGPLNPVAKPIIEMVRRDGSWCGLARDVVSEAEYRKCEYYDGWGRKYGSFHTVIGTVKGEGQTLTSISVMRPERSGPLGPEAIRRVEILLPHLRRAFKIHEQMEALRLRAEGAQAALEVMETAVIAVDGEGSVIGMNRRAEQILERNGSLTLRGRKLVATQPSQEEELDAFIRSAASTGAGRGMGSGGAMALRSSEGTPALLVSATPFRSSHLLTEDRPCSLVFLSDSGAAPASRGYLLRSLFELTPSECRLADLLLETCDLRAVAERMRITYNTSRFMLKCIFQKTGTRRQAELIRLLMKLPAETEPPTGLGRSKRW